MKKIFLYIYLLLFFLHLVEQTYTHTLALALCVGFLFGLASHHKRVLHIAPLLLVIHMGIEISHHIEHKHAIGIHAAHSLMDILLLWTMTQSTTKTLLWIGGVVLITTLFSFIHIEQIGAPEGSVYGFILGGIGGCLASHQKIPAI